MPELPEVETTLQGISPYLRGQSIQKIIVRFSQLRWPIPNNLAAQLEKQTIQTLSRRGKYLLLHFKQGTLILHLGMSGRLSIVTAEIPPKKHDHLDFILQNKKILRFTDPRRFGACLWSENPAEHFLLKHLGVEPLSKKFSGEYLFKKSRARKIPIKTFIMNHKIVTGVGNIYAAESLFAAKIHPETAANKISLLQYQMLTKAIIRILKQAIKKGGTTLKDFLNSEGKPGYFNLKLKVYGRAGLPCFDCKKPLQQNRLGQRSTVFCVNCQKKAT